MKGRLMPADGGSAFFNDMVKLARANAHLDSSKSIVERTARNLAKQSSALDGVKGTLATYNLEAAAAQGDEAERHEQSGGIVSPGDMGKLVPPQKGLGRGWEPVSVQAAHLNMHENGMEKEAYLGMLQAGIRGAMGVGRGVLGAGRAGAAALARTGGRPGKVGRFLQQDIRSPIQKVTPGTFKVRSPLGGTPIPKKPGRGGPYREPAVPKQTPTQKPSQSPKKTVKPKGIIRSVLPGAALLAGGYGLYKGIPAVTGELTRQSQRPMPYGFGYQQYPNVTG
jgi:hypothetical protein